MSKAYKCDRCGWYFDEYVWRLQKKVFVGAQCEEDKSYDLCDYCREDFEKWFEGEEEL